MTTLLDFAGFYCRFVRKGIDIALVGVLIVIIGFLRDKHCIRRTVNIHGLLK